MRLHIRERIRGLVRPVSMSLLLAMALWSALALTMSGAVMAVSSNMTVTSDNTTLVMTGNVPGAIYPYPAVLAWQPYDPSNNHWDTSITGYVFSGSARWIWESYRVVHPLTGDVVDFKKDFYIPGNPTAGTLYITCDNGFEVRINDTLVGSDDLGANWRSSNLTESFVQTYDWQGIESYNITPYLVRGANHIEIATANEYYGPLDGQSNGTIDINPAAVIFEAVITCETVMPTVTTSNATFVEETTATLHGSVTDDGGEACQYRFVYGTAPDNYTLDTGWTENVTIGQPFSFDVTGLGKGTKYYFRAQVKNSAGIGSGDEFNFLTKPDPPIETTFIATVISDTQINLSWTKGEGALNTMIRRKTGDFPSNRNDGVLVYFDTGTSCSDTGLTPETLYYYRAWSYVTGSEQWSDGYRDATAQTSPAAPPVTPVAVGGSVNPVNKAQVLAPWLGVLLIFTLVTGSIVIKIVRMRKSTH